MMKERIASIYSYVLKQNYSPIMMGKSPDSNTFSIGIFPKGWTQKEVNELISDDLYSVMIAGYILQPEDE